MSAGPVSLAHVATAVPRRYLGQLCKHFQHKLPVELEQWRGRIAFPAGCCELDAGAEFATLVLRISARDEASLAELEDVIGRHLHRIALRDRPEIAWRRAA